MLPWLPLVVFVLAAVLSGCAPSRPSPGVVRTWVAGATRPDFDPEGPPHALRWALERLLSRGLVERDSAGHVRPAAAESLWASADARTWTFRLRPGLRYTDGSPVTSADFAAALAAGLAREDHATRLWLLGALAGAEKVRAGRPLPALGLATPDPRTLVVTLTAPDPALPEKLALPGVATPWKRRAAIDWRDAVGLGPYRVLAAEGERALVLVRADSLAPARALADTLRVRFVTGAPRVRTLLRTGAADVVWPLPPAFFGTPLPAGYRLASLDAEPRRRLLLVLRADVPPTTKPAARFALAHALDRSDLLEALGPRGRETVEWLPGAGPFDFPRLDAATSHEWLARGKLGASIHVVLSYDLDLAGADAARALQGAWARQGFYAELRGTRGAAAVAEPLHAAAGQAQLVESQALLPGTAAELAALVMPLRGPAVGAFRTGWRTREFDAWLRPGAGDGPDPAAVQARLAEERNVLPVADLPWLWVERDGGGAVHPSPRFGPEFATIPATGGPRMGSR